jgi:hypothetical protein
MAYNDKTIKALSGFDNCSCLETDPKYRERLGFESLANHLIMWYSSFTKLCLGIIDFSRNVFSTTGTECFLCMFLADENFSL